MSIQVPTLTQQLADKIARTCVEQLRVSKQYKSARFGRIMESEKMYFGDRPKTLVRQEEEPLPFMSGFVDHLNAELDDAPDIEFSHTDEADYKTAKKITAFYQAEKASVLPHAKWNLKDRWCTKLATFSGRGIYKYYAESYPTYRSVLQVVDHYDFHCEPGGGGHLENHLFCGEEGIFKTREELAQGAQEEFYDQTQLGRILLNTSAADHKDNQDDYNQRLNRHEALSLDPQSNNYTGQEIFKFAEWYTTFEGVRWYCLFDDRTGQWIRIKPLREIFPLIESTGDALYPYCSWATHEDAKVFWSKAPCDDARPIHRRIEKIFGQEVYNREKANKGVRLYDPHMITDVEALADERPDGLIPVDTRSSKLMLNRAIYPVPHTPMGNNGLELIGFLDSYHGRKSGTTTSTEGQAEKNKKVGIFLGEIEQLKKRLSVANKSKRECWAEIGLRFMLGLDDHLQGEMPIRLIGPSGVEWTSLTSEDLKRNRPLDIKVSGGTEESQRNEILSAKKSNALTAAVTVNPRWKDRELLKNAGYSDDQIKEAFSDLDSANQDLMSEAARAIEEILDGKEPEINRGATVAFMQKIIDFGNALTLKDKKKEEALAIKMYQYAAMHAGIASENERRASEARELVVKKSQAGMPINSPEAAATGAVALQNAEINAGGQDAPIPPQMFSRIPQPAAALGQAPAALAREVVT